MQNVKEIKHATSLCVPDFNAIYYHFFTYFFLHYTFLCNMVTDHGVAPCWVCGWQKEVDTGMELP